MSGEGSSTDPGHAEGPARARGARLPKHLMLYVKNMIFLDAAIAQLSISVAEVTRIWVTSRASTASASRATSASTGIDEH